MNININPFPACHFGAEPQSGSTGKNLSNLTANTEGFPSDQAGAVIQIDPQILKRYLSQIGGQNCRVPAGINQPHAATINPREEDLALVIKFAYEEPTSYETLPTRPYRAEVAVDMDTGLVKSAVGKTILDESTDLPPGHLEKMKPHVEQILGNAVNYKALCVIENNNPTLHRAILIDTYPTRPTVPLS